MALLAALHADHAITGLALEALVLLLETCADLVPAQGWFVIALAVSAIGADASRALRYFDEVMILEMQVQAVDQAKLAVMHVLTHLLLLTTGETDVVVEAIAGGVELITDVVYFGGVEVRHRDAFGHCLHFRQEF